MANDIDVITSGNPINEVRAYVTTLPTGETASIMRQSAYLVIDDIDNKYANRFKETIVIGG